MTYDDYRNEKADLTEKRDKAMRSAYEEEREVFDGRLRSRQATIRKDFDEQIKLLDKRYYSKYDDDHISPGPVS